MNKKTVRVLLLLVVAAFCMSSMAFAADEPQMEIVDGAVIMEPTVDSMPADTAGEVMAEEQSSPAENESDYDGSVEKLAADDFLYKLVLEPVGKAVYKYLWIEGYTGPGGAVTIPEISPAWDSMRIFGITEDAFDYDTSITSIYMPDGLYVEPGSFYKCSNLKSVRFPGTMKGVWSRTFAHCTSLKSINISSNWTQISDYAFADTGFSSFTVPENVESIRDYAFSSCQNLKWVYIPEKTAYIYDMAFEGCPSSMIIKGVPGSEAQRYAKEHGFKFESSLKAPAAPTNTKAASAGYNKIKVSWQRSTGADGYYVYRAEAKDGTYKRIAGVTGMANQSYEDSGLVTGRAYYYKVAAYTNVNGKAHKSGGSNVAGAKPKFGYDSYDIGIYSDAPKTVTIYWKHIQGSSGYDVYRCPTGNGTYKYISTVKASYSPEYIDKGLKSGSKYYYKVVPYRTQGGIKYKAAAMPAGGAEVM